MALRFQRWAHFYMHTILSQLMEISALKPALRNITYSEINEKALKNEAKEKHEFERKKFTNFN